MTRGHHIRYLGSWVVSLSLLGCQGGPSVTAKPQRPSLKKQVPAAQSVTVVPPSQVDPTQEVPGPIAIPPQVVAPPATTPAPVPVPSAAPAPTVQPSAAPPPVVPEGIPAEEAALASRLSGKLLAIAQVSFAQNRGQLATSQAVLGGTTAPVGLIANNAGSLIANNGGGLIANNGGGLIANNSGGLIANNGGGLGGARGYRVQQATVASGAVSVEPLAGETLFADRRWTDGRRSMLFVKNVENTDDAFRRLEFERNAVFRNERRFETLEKWPNDAVKRASEVQLDYYPTGLQRSNLAYLVEKTDANRTVRISFQPEVQSFIREPDTGVSLAIKGFTVDAEAKNGSFHYLYEHLGATEIGTLSNVKPTEAGQIIMTYDDPLGFYDGESTLRNKDGAVVYTKRQVREGTARSRVYDLQGGLEARLVETPEGDWTGDVYESGVAVARLTMKSYVDGSVIFELTLPGAADKPIQLGYGVTDPNAPKPKPPTLAPMPEVVTLAGSTTAGFANGDGSAARFESLAGIVASKRDPRLYYIADFGNARIRTLAFSDAGTWSIGTLAGDGVQASVDGPLATARFCGPSGLATVAGPGGAETLYVADQASGKIRAVELDATGSGTVSTLAGAGLNTTLDGPGATASFRAPAGICHDPAGQRLLVAEVLGHRIRAVALNDPTHPVTTLVGSEEGFLDGVLADAKLNRPFGVALDPSRRLYVADGNNRRLRRIDLTAASPRLETVAGSGVALEGMRDGSALQAGLNPPKTVAIDPAGHVITSNFDLRVFTPGTNQVRTLAGGLLGGYLDGRIDLAMFKQVNGLAIGPNGTLLVTDEHRVRLVLHPADDGVLIP